MSAPLTAAKRAELAAMADEALRIALEGWDIARTLLDGVDTEFGAVRTGFMGMTNHGVYSTYDGPVAVLNGEGGRIGSFTGTDYTKFIEEYSEDWSYLKFVRLKGGENYRVGPLARLNIVEKMGTEHADAALAEYRERFGTVSQAALAYNLARYVEFIASCERAVKLLSDSGITGTDVRTPAVEVVNRRGVGIIEAPRGTLIHDYIVNDAGIIERCNLIVATCQNNYAIDRGVEDVARRVVKNGALSNGAANQIEMVIRAYDPCISCATHAIGRMPMKIELVRKA